MKFSPPRTRARGYTLIELSLAMVTGMMVAVLMLAMVNQQIAFLRIYNAQSFLTTEAPLISNYLSRVIGSADGYRLYESVEDLVDGSPPVLTAAPVVMLRFKEPDGTFRASVISFEDPGTGRGLYYRMVNSAGVLGSPDWALSKRPADVDFSVVQGILRVRVAGPNGEEIFYSGNQQL
jgi:hypothetical protein